MSIGVRAVRGAVWTIGSTLGSRLIALTGTLLLTRYLAPEVAGEVNVAYTLVAMAALLTDLGLLHYLVTRRQTGQEGIFHAAVMYLLFGAAGFGLIILVGPYVAPLFGAQGDPARYIPGLAGAMMIERLGLVPERVMVRELKMRPVAIARSLGELAYTASSIAFAVSGFGGFAIVYGNVVRNLIYASIVYSAGGLGWAQRVPWNWERVREIFKFALPLHIGGVAYWSSRRTDNLLFSRMFGLARLGHYNQAYNLADIPATNVGEHLGEVLLPAMSQMEPDQRRDALLRGTVLICMIMFPLAIGLGVVAPTAVHAFFTEEWWPVGSYVAILSVLSVTRPIHWTVGNYVQACGLTKIHVYLNVPHVIVLLTSIYVFGQFGPLWACVGVGFAYSLLSFAAVVVVRVVDKVPIGRFLGTLVPPLIACAPMAGGVLGVRWLLARQGFGPSLFTLVVEVAVGALTFVPSALVLAPTASREMLRLVRAAMSRRSGG